MPDSPMNAFFLTEQEKYYAVQRLAENRTGIVNKQWKWDQAIEAVIDPKTWILFFFNIAINIPNGGMNGVLLYYLSPANSLTRTAHLQRNHHQWARILACYHVSSQYANWRHVHAVCFCFLLAGFQMG